MPWPSDHADADECIKNLGVKHRLLAEQVVDLTWQVSRLADEVARDAHEGSDRTRIRDISEKVERLGDEIESLHV